MKKKLALALVVVLAFALGVSGTFAYLTAQTDKITNTFTVGNVAITLDEAKVGSDGKALTGEKAERVTANSYTVVPGQTADKDPTVTVTDGDDAWVFIGVNNPNGNNITFTINTGWTQVGTYTVITGEGAEAVSTVYTVYGYDTKVAKNGTATLFDEVRFSNDIVVDQTFQNIALYGFAVQTAGFNTAQAAWNSTFGA